MRVIIALLVLLSSARAFAYGAGVFGYSGKPPAQSCTQCHSGGSTPSVMLSGPASLPASGTGTYALDIVTGASTNAAGFDVATSDGTLGKVVQMNESWINAGELSHTKNWPKGAMVRVQFTLAAPASGPVTLYATALSSDGVDDTGGDGVASTTFTVDIDSNADLAGTDLAGEPDDLAVVDAVSSATTMTLAPQPDLGPPHDEPRWACACEVARAPRPMGGELLVGLAALFAMAALRRRARR